MTLSKESGLGARTKREASFVSFIKTKNPQLVHLMHSLQVVVNCGQFEKINIVLHPNVILRYKSRNLKRNITGYFLFLQILNGK